jgi:membrane protein
VEELSAPAPTKGHNPPARPGRRAQAKCLKWWYAALSSTLHRTLLSVIDHDCLNVAQSTAYSAIVALFPALIVAAAIVSLLPDTAPVRFQLAAFFDRVLPPGVSPLLDAAFEITPKHAHSVRALISAGFVSFLGASNVIATLMEGFRRARELPPDCWSFWQRRRRTVELVPLCLAPLAVFSVFIIFGHAATGWLVSSIGPEVRTPIYVITVLVRWMVALGASVGLIAIIYHLGVPASRPGSPRGRRGRSSREIYRRSVRSDTASALLKTLAPRTWRVILPGAVLATAMWFLTTLVFGWYVTRYANYSEVYGSLGAGIALLFWLYIVSLSVLCGAEFNAQFDNQVHGHFGRRPVTPTTESAVEQSPALEEPVAPKKSI